MSNIYLPDPVALRLKQTAKRQNRTVSAVLIVMLDFEEVRLNQEQAVKEQFKKDQVRK